MKNFLSNSIITFLCFSLLFGVKFSFFPIALSKIALGLLFLLYLLDTTAKRRFVVSRQLVPLIVVFVLLGIYSVFVTLIQGNNDFGFASRMVYIVYEPILASFLFSYYITYVQPTNVNSFIIALRNAGLIQAVLTIPAYFNDGIRALYDSILPNTGNIKLENLTQRVRGFSNLGGAWLSSMLCISFFCALHEIEKYKNRLLNVIALVLLLLAMMVTGRTGLMISILALFVYIIRWIIKGKVRKTLGYIAVIVTIGVIALLNYYPEVTDSVNQETVEWAFEAVSSDKIGETKSGDHLKEMIYLPSEGLFWGNGLYIQGTHKLPRSDSGYIKTLLAIGLIPGLTFYLIYVYVCIDTLRKQASSDGAPVFLIAFILGIAFIVELKEPYLQTLGYTFVIFSFFFIANMQRLLCIEREQQV